MELISGGLTPLAFWSAIAVTLLAGFVKGAIGFAMPLIMMSAFTSFMSPTTALAGLILATLSTNVHQTLRDGWRPAWAAARARWRMILLTVIGIVITAPFATQIPQRLLLGLLGGLIAAFALLQLSGLRLTLAPGQRRPAEYLAGIIGGLYGGVSGIWGPPVVVWLLATETPKAEAVRVQGVIFLIGSVVLLAAHLNTGVLNAVTLPFAAALILPAALGMVLGFRVQDRLDAVLFRRWTLILLAITALNLLRKAIFG